MVSAFIPDWMKDGLDSVGGFAADIVSQVTDGIDATLEPILSTIDRIDDAVGSITSEVVETVSGLPDLLEEKVRAAADAATAGVAGIQAGIESVIEGGIDGVLSTLGGAIESTSDFIGTQIDGVLDSVEGIADTVERNVIDPISNIVDGLVTSVGEILERVTSPIAELVSSIPEDISRLIGGIDEWATSIGSDIQDAATKPFTSFFDHISEEVTERLEPIIKMLEDDDEVPDELKAMTAPGLLPLGAAGGIVAGLALPLLMASALQTIITPWLTRVQQKMSGLANETLMSSGELTQMYHRGHIPLEDFYHYIHRAGFGDGVLPGMLELSRVRPDTFQALDLWRRGDWDDERLDEELKLQGWTGDYVQALKVLAYPIPGPSDLVRFSVRDVFTPEVVERFGLFDDLPPRFVEVAKQAGISEEWATAYWGAHWALPSIGQGFNMFHRTLDESPDPDADTILLPDGSSVQNVIGSETLDMLMRTADITPYWRDKLKAISYTRLTRVDVRRAHKIGILSESDVYRSYKDLGYTDKDADTLTKFVLAYNSKADDDGLELERDLTKSDILGAYIDRILTRNETNHYLTQLGYTDEDVQLLIRRVDVQEERTAHKETINNILAEGLSGAITLDDAQDRLDSINATALEKGKVIDRLERELAVRTRRPTLAQLQEFYSIGFLAGAELVSQLELEGFSDQWVAANVTQLSIGAAAGSISEFRSAMEQRDYDPSLIALFDTLTTVEDVAVEDGEFKTSSKSELDRWARTGLISRSDYIEQLTIKAYSPDDIARHVQFLEGQGAFEDEQIGVSTVAGSGDTGTTEEA